MERWLISVLGGFSVLCSPAAAQTPGLTFNDIESLTDAEIIARTMALIGADVVHVNRQPQRVVFIDPAEPSRTNVKFMLRPHAVAGMRGLCVISFWDIGYEEGGTHRPPQHAFRGLSVERRYRVVGEVALTGDKGTSASKKTEALCAAINTPEQLLTAPEDNAAFQAASLAQAIARPKGPPPQIDCRLAAGCKALLESLSANAIGWAAYCYEGADRTWKSDETCTEFSVRGTGDETYSDVYLRVVAASEFDPFRWRIRTLSIERRMGAIE